MYLGQSIYVNVDSPNLGFTNFNFLGGYQLKKTPCIFISISIYWSETHCWLFSQSLVCGPHSIPVLHIWSGKCSHRNRPYVTKMVRNVTLKLEIKKAEHHYFTAVEFWSWYFLVSRWLERANIDLKLSMWIWNGAFPYRRPCNAVVTRHLKKNLNILL